MFYQAKKLFAGHIKVLGGPHLARGQNNGSQRWKHGDPTMTNSNIFAAYNTSFAISDLKLS